MKKIFKNFVPVLLIIAGIITIYLVILNKKQNNSNNETIESKRKVYNMIKNIDYIYDVNDPIQAYEHFDEVAILKIESIDDVRRYKNRGVCFNTIVTEGKGTIIKNIKGNIENIHLYNINDGEILFSEWLKCEKEPEKTKKYYEELLGNLDNYYIKYSVRDIESKNVDKGKTYLVFMNRTEKDIHTISSNVLYEVKEENGNYLILNNKTKKYESIEKYLPKEASK